MKRVRYVLIMLWALYSAPSYSDQMSIGIELHEYPELILVPGYPVYYAPQLRANYFFYDGEYWVYLDDNWYESPWYNGPWWLVDPEEVPVFLLRIPVRYYLQPPTYFFIWLSDEPPHWGEHWGHDWERHRRGWDRWDRDARHEPAPLPDYQRQYSGDRYPRHLEQQRELQQQNYGYQPRTPVVQRHYQERSMQSAPVQLERQRHVRGPAQQDVQHATPRQQDNPVLRAQATQKNGTREQETTTVSPQREHPVVQERRQQPLPEAGRREQEMQRPQDREFRQQGDDGARESNRGQGRDRERGRDR
jgi:hypothetical protein